MLQVSEADASAILEKYRGQSVQIKQLTPIHNPSFDAFTTTSGYSIRAHDGTSYLLKVAEPTSTTSTPYVPNTLTQEHALRNLVASQTDVPNPTVHVLDTSGRVVPYHYLLLSQPAGISLAAARASGKLSARQLATIELRAGSYLKTLHERVQNDWFGTPAQDKDELYSWQEAFTLLIEGALEDARSAGVELPYEDVRRCLSRAIGFFLFDDCEVPSLVSFTGDEHAVVVDWDERGGEDADVRVTSFGSFGHAVWGDPLLETMFMDPSAALVEGYGGPLIVFARQKTKRLWYTLFLSLMVLIQAKRLGRDESHEMVIWARERVEKTAKALKDAPCY